MSTRAPDRHWQAHPTWPVEGSAEWWADLQAQIVEEYLPGERDAAIGLRLVVGAFVTGVLFALVLFVWPFVALVLGAAVGVDMGGMPR